MRDVLKFQDIYNRVDTAADGARETGENISSPLDCTTHSMMQPVVAMTVYATAWTQARRSVRLAPQKRRCHRSHSAVAAVGAGRPGIICGSRVTLGQSFASQEVFGDRRGPSCSSSGGMQPLIPVPSRCPGLQGQERSSVHCCSSRPGHDIVFVSFIV